MAGSVGGCDAVGGVFGRMFAIPPRDTTYFTPNSKFYVVNYADSAVSMSRDAEHRTMETLCQRRREHSDVARLARYSESRLLRSSLHTHVHRYVAGRRQHGERDMARHLTQETAAQTAAPMKRPRAMSSFVASMATTTAFRSHGPCKTT